ncbi:hypothetical protein [Wenyingzhuangia sp. IMCC45574]
MKLIKVKNKSCSEDWDKMTNEEKGKFCKKCSTKVIDFTKLNSSEILNEFRNNKETLCARITNSQIEAPLITYSLKEIGIITTASIIMASSINDLHANQLQRIDSHNVASIIQEKITNFTGTVYDTLYKRKIYNAKVEFITLNKIYSTYTDKKGRFSLIIPNEIIANSNIVRFSFEDIIIPEYKSIEDASNDSCAICFNHNQFTVLNKEDISKPFLFESTPDIFYVGSADYLFDSDYLPLVFFKGEEILFTDFIKNKDLKVYNEILYLPPIYSEKLLGYENKYGIYLCF